MRHINFLSRTEDEMTEHKLDMDDVMAAVERDDCTGFCLACGNEQDGCEPDATDYECEACGEHKVYGAEECMIMFA
jgi:hypothetical protein